RDGLGGERGGHGENRRAGAGEGGPECARRARRGGDRVVAAHQRAAVRRVQHVVERRRKERRVGPRQAGDERRGLGGGRGRGAGGHGGRQRRAGLVGLER